MERLELYKDGALDSLGVLNSAPSREGNSHPVSLSLLLVLQMKDGCSWSCRTEGCKEGSLVSPSPLVPTHSSQAEFSGQNKTENIQQMGC